MAKTDINAGEIQKLEERVKKLAADKSYLELIIRLIHKMSTVSGLENTIDSMLQNILDVIGGENLILYYKIDNIVYYSDVFGKKMCISVITDALVNDVFEKNKAIEFEHSFNDTRLTTNEFTQAYTWVFPLQVGQETIGVLKMENMMMGKRELSQQLPMFFSYVALVLKNEILGHSRLKQINEQLNTANEILKKAKEELEIRVADRTFELQQANVQLQAELFERQRVEDALREQYSTLHGIIESTNSVIFSIDTQYRYTSFNSLHAAVMRQIYGVEILNGHSILDYMTVAEDRAKAKQNLDRALAGERFIEGAFSGDEGMSRRYFEVSHNPVKSTDGSVVGVAVLSRDITERKMAEEAIRASEEKYRTLIQKIQAAVVVHSADTHILTCNPSAELLLGLTEDQLMGKEATDPAWHFFRENRTPMPFDEYPVNRVLTTGRALSNFVTGIHRPGNANGNDVWVIVNADPVFGKENEIVQVIVTFTDITERKTAEDALQRSNRELRAISNCNQVLLRAHDEQTLLNEICSIVCNEAGYKMAWVGYAQNDEAKTISPVAWAGPDSSYISNAKLTWAETSGNGNGPAGKAIRNGEIIYVQDFANDPLMLPWRESVLQHGYKSGIALPLKDENTKVFGVLLIYSTEINAITPDEIRLLEELSGDLAYGIINLRTRAKHKQAEEKLIASEERYKRITSGITDYLYTVTIKNGRVIETIHNEACQLITGYTPKEFIDDPYLWIHMVVPEDRELVGNKFSRIIEGKDFTPIEHRIICKDGQIRWISDTAIPKYNENGELVSYDGVIKDITERKKAEEALYEGQQVFRILVECSPDIIARYDLDFKRTYVNPVYLKEAQMAQEELLSSSPMQISPLPTDSAVALQYLLRKVLSSGVAEAIDVIWPKADNIDYWYNIFAFPEFDREGNVVSVMTISRDITVHKRIEEERVAKLRYFENIDTFNKIFQEGTDVEQMMKNVLDAVLRIFDCDRAFLMYPCDPASDFWKVPMESCKPEYPGVLQLGLEIPMDAGVAESLRILLDSNRPVKFGPGTAYPLPAEISEQFGFKCFMSMAIYPKVGKPWQFGIHQCSYARNWTPDEERLLKEIGWRFADAITNLMVFRDLQQSEKKFHRIVDTANEGIWLLGPDHLTTFVNARMTEIIGYSLEELVGKPVSDFMFDEDVPDYQNNLLTRIQGLPDTFESRLLHKDGRTIWVNVATTPVSDDGESFSGSFAMLTDITNRKHAEGQILKLNRIYSVLSNINQTIVRIHEPEGMLEAACQIAVEYGGFLMAWIGMVDFGTNRVVATASHGIVGDYLEQINIDLADEARSNGPTGIAIKTGRHKISNNIEDDESMILWRDSAITYGYKSSAAFPIIVYGKIVGAFNIYSGETGFFEEDDIKLLDEMAIDISFALEYIESESMRNQAEAELQKSEERYRLIAENTADTITVFDLNLNITYISPSVFKLRGFTPDEAAAQSLDKMLTPGSLQKAIPVFTNEMTLEAKATEDITRTTLLELEEYCKDGSTIWVEISVSILRDTTLKPTGLLTVTRDISQRKLLEFQLRNSEQEFRSLAESSPDIIIRYNLDCRAIYANQRFFKTVPADPQSFIGKTPIESYPTVMEEYQAKLQKVIETGVPEYLELQLTDVDGNTITHYVCFVAELDNDGKRIGALAIGRDITELRQSEEKVKQLSRAVEQSPVSILITDSDGRIQYLNKKITEITGYYPEELIGKTPRIFSSGEHPAEKYKELWETVSSGNEWRGEFHNKKKSGELFWELASISPIKDESGKCTQYLAVKEDITAKKELENNLISAKERAELANKLKDAFIANISHEIRTPLNGIVGMTSIIRDLYSKYIKEDEEHYFASISRSSRRLMISVDKILNFSRLQIGDFPLKLSRVSIAAVLEAVVTEYQKYSQEKSLQLIFNSAVEDGKVFVDETAIETAFAVIVENAIKFTEAGTVTIELYRDASNYLCVEVRDTGIGISDDYLSHLFEPYTQEFTGYSRPFEGVGLGLSIAKKLFDLNKACIEVSSKKGKGSIFKVCFKYQEEILPKLNFEAQENKPKQTPSPTKPHIKAGTNILVVEDDAINQIFIKSILKKDYQIVLAADADKAFKFFQNQQFDLILMDISLKHGMNGLELTRLIRSGARNSAVPIIAVTGHAFPTDRQNALESGCTDYLSKPFEPEDLLEKVKLYV